MSKSQHNTLCIAEWQVFGKKDIQEAITDKSEKKAKKIFKELKNFANQKSNFDDREGNHIFLTPYHNNRLKARNFVGLIQTKSGFCLEILPKTFRTAKDSEGFAIKNCTCSLLRGSETDEAIQNGVDCHADKSARNDSSKNQQCQVCQAKQILLDMLKTLKNSPFKQSHISTLKTQHFPLLEVFAIMFLDELERLIKKGIKSDYVVREENRYFLKGKLLFTQNLKHNFAHKERFFTQSDEFIADIAPNRLIVSTLLFLSRCNFSAKTSTRLMQSRFVFDEIAPSQNYDKDFAKCTNLKRFKSYELILLWCKVFLKRQSFTTYEGSEKAFALLFDMNKLFESFVAWHLKRTLKNHIVKAQYGRKFLIQNDKFRIKPDLVIYGKDDIDLEKAKAKVIADTKWKILDFNRDDYGISQADLYQVFAYLAKYQCAKGYLIYPKIVGNESINHKSFAYKAQICFYNDKLKENPPPHKEQKIMLEIYLFDIIEPKKSSQNFFDTLKFLPFSYGNIKKF